MRAGAAPAAVIGARGAGAGAEARRPASSRFPRLDPANILWFFGGFLAGAAGKTVISRVHPSARGSGSCSPRSRPSRVRGRAAWLRRAGWRVPAACPRRRRSCSSSRPTCGLSGSRVLARRRRGRPARGVRGPVLVALRSRPRRRPVRFTAVRFPFVLAVLAAAVVCPGSFSFQFHGAARASPTTRTRRW